MTSEQPQEERNFEQNTLIWFDENLNDGEDVNQIKPKLRQIINYVKIFTNADECVDYMSTNEKEQIYFLISGSSADAIVPLTYEMSQVKFIYIFSINTPYSGESTARFDKVQGVFTDSTMLCDALRRDISTKKSSSTYNSSTLLLSALPSSGSDRSDRQEAAFMYFRLLTDVLVELRHKQSTKNEFISICRSQYDGNTSELEKIEEFKHSYTKEQAIRWYTRDSFLYRILNNALRTQDIDILFKLGFFIADLHNQLVILHLEQSKSKMLPSVVYRGQFMTKDEFINKIIKNMGGFLSINSFLSTSANKEVASMFASHSSSDDSNIESVLFEITIESEQCRRPVAGIKHMSYMAEEDEILFSMATVFRIESAQKSDSENIWIVRLLMNGEEDEELNAVANTIKKEFGHSDSLNSFGGTLMKMGDFERAEQYILMVINDTQPDDVLSKAWYYSNLSTIYNEQRNYDTALYWAEKALQLLPSDLHLMISIYNNVGLSYLNTNHAVEALHYFHKVVDLCKNILLSNHWTLPIAYINLGTLYEKQDNLSKALEYYFKAFDIYKSTLPANHPKLASAYGRIGGIYLRQNDCDSALFYLLKTLEIQQRSLTAKHQDLVHTYVNLAVVYSQQSNDMESYNMLQKAIEIIGSTIDHPALSVIMFYVGRFHERRKNISEALKFFHKALDANMKCPMLSDRMRIVIYKGLGGLYALQKNWKNAIDYYQRAIPLAHTYKDDDLVFFYNMISYGYGLNHDYERATEYVELALDIGCSTLPANHHYIQMAKEHQALLKSVQRGTCNKSENVNK